jgi:hypothetical protein
MKTLTLPPPIDYSAHPAFRGLGVTPVAEHKEREQLAHVERIDDRFRSFLDSRHASLDELRRSFDASVASEVRALLPQVLEGVTDPKTRAWVEKSFAMTAAQLLEEAEFTFRKQSFRAPARSTVEKNLRDMHDDGFAKFPISREQKRTMQEGFAPHVERVKEIAAARPTRRASVPLPGVGAWGRALRDALHSSGFMDAASEFQRCPMVLHYISLEIAQPGQDWYQGCYQDVGLGTAKTTYLHYDYEVSMVKGMVYLSDVVAEGDGPFGYLPGSHRWSRSAFRSSLYRNMDLSFAQLFDPENKSYYYRPRFHTVDERCRFLGFPKWMQGTSHFGDDLVDGSELSNEILAREKKLVGDEPCAVMFDSSRIAHRGSLATTGKRIALQLAFSPRDPSSALVRAAKEARRVAGRARRGEPLF